MFFKDSVVFFRLLSAGVFYCTPQFKSPSSRSSRCVRVIPFCFASFFFGFFWFFFNRGRGELCSSSYHPLYLFVYCSN